MGWSQLMLRTKAAPAVMANAVRQTVDSLGHEYVAKTHMVVETIDRSILRERLFAILSAFFGVLALLLAGIGLYGLMAYNVTRLTGNWRARHRGGRENADDFARTLRLTSLELHWGWYARWRFRGFVANMFMEFRIDL